MSEIAGRPTDRVRLRPAEYADVDVFLLQQQDPEANRRANSTALSPSDFLAHWRDRILDDDAVHARTVLADEQIAGYIVAWWKDTRRCVGYWMGREFWGSGIGTEALGQFLGLEPVRPLFADTDIDNAASRRLLERCGFRLIETHSRPSAEYQVFMLE